MRAALPNSATAPPALPAGPSPGAAHRSAAFPTAGPADCPASGPPALPAALLERFTRQRLARGYLLSTPGAARNRILYLQEGRIRVFVASEDKELTLAYLSAGELFSTHTRAYLRCESACMLLSMPTGEFARSMAHEPGMLGLVMPVLGRILDNSIALIEDLAFRDVAGRLARFMLVSARQQGVALAPGMRFTLDLAASEIALLLGCTRQTVSSLFRRMEREAIIMRSARRQFVVLQPEQLLRWQEGNATCTAVPGIEQCVTGETSEKAAAESSETVGQPTSRRRRNG